MYLFVYDLKYINVNFVSKLHLYFYVATFER